MSNLKQVRRHAIMPNQNINIEQFDLNHQESLTIETNDSSQSSEQSPQQQNKQILYPPVQKKSVVSFFQNLTFISTQKIQELNQNYVTKNFNHDEIKQKIDNLELKNQPQNNNVYVNPSLLDCTLFNQFICSQIDQSFFINYGNHISHFKDDKTNNIFEDRLNTFISGFNDILSNFIGIGNIDQIGLADVQNQKIVREYYLNVPINMTQQKFKIYASNLNGDLIQYDYRKLNEVSSNNINNKPINNIQISENNILIQQQQQMLIYDIRNFQQIQKIEQDFKQSKLINDYVYYSQDKKIHKLNIKDQQEQIFEENHDFFDISENEIIILEKQNLKFFDLDMNLKEQVHIQDQFDSFISNNKSIFMRNKETVQVYNYCNKQQTDTIKDKMRKLFKI